MESPVGGFHLRERATGSFHPATADGNLLFANKKTTNKEQQP